MRKPLLPLFALVTSASLHCQSVDATLIGSDDEVDSILQVDTLTGGSSLIGTNVAPSSIESLAYDANTGRFFGFDVDADTLVDINSSTGLATPIGAGGVNGVIALAFDTNNDVLYGVVRFVTDYSLVILDTETGLAITVGRLDQLVAAGRNIFSLAFDPLTDTLYGTAVLSGAGLYEIDRSTGAASKVADLENAAGREYRQVRALAYDPTFNSLFGVDQELDVLIRINSLTGLSTEIGPVNTPQVNGLAFNGPVPETIPEPATLALLTIGIVGAGFVRKRL